MEGKILSMHPTLVITTTHLKNITRADNIVIQNACIKKV